MTTAMTPMQGRVVCDASAMVASLIDAGPDGIWAAEMFDGVGLAAPELMDFEAANILRRLELRREISADQAAQAHADLVALEIENWPYELLATRVWELRSNLTCHDASYVAVAELLDAPLITLDTGTAGAPGLECGIVTP